MIEQYSPKTEAERIAFATGRISALVQFHVQKFNSNATEAHYVYPHQPIENLYEDYPSGDYEMSLFYGIQQELSPYPVASISIGRTTWWSWEDRVNDELPHEEQGVTFTIGKNLLLKTGSILAYYSGADDYFVADYQTLNAQIPEDSIWDVQYHPPLKTSEEDLLLLISELQDSGNDTRFLQRISFPLLI